jgi:[acyl-carrier-protein] S-malonyltransferase
MHDTSRSFGSVVFPGQGAQRRGMSIDFADAYPEARAVFAAAARALPFDVEAICREEDARINLTEFTQPCIVTAEIACFEVLKERHGLRPRYFGGHSLGEYSALVAAGAIPLEPALKLVHLRGKLMQQAVPAGVGAMAALISSKLPMDEIRAAAQAHGVDVANDNSPEQVVVSGEAQALDRLLMGLSHLEAQGLRAVRLTVSAPFHSRHMKPIEAEFGAALEKASADLDPSRATCVLSNWTGAFHTGRKADLIEALTRQISGTVRWRDNMEALRGSPEHAPVLEVGPDRPLRGFFKAVGLTVTSVVDSRTAKRAFQSEAAQSS